jgi:23S rRNA G2069 N7-methylase RlmK/C1962 C5-methylase RlmI
LELDWDVQRDHGGLLRQLAPHITSGGMVYFSTNFRRFKLDEAALGDYSIRDITRQTIPEDFRNERIHKCWVLARHGAEVSAEADHAEAQRSRREEHSEH